MAISSKDDLLLNGGIKPELFQTDEKLIDSASGTAGTGTSADDSNTTASVTTKKKRKTKKNILESKNINIKQLIDIENNKLTNEQQINFEIQNSLNLVQERFASITDARKSDISENGYFNNNSNNNNNNNNNSNNVYGSNSGGSGRGGRSSISRPDSWNMEVDMSSGMIGSGGDSALPFPDSDYGTGQMNGGQMSGQAVGQASPAVGTGGMSKFQQQMSGMWNQQVGL